MLTGCFNSDVSNVEDTVWKTYNNEKFAVNYPSKNWNVINEKFENDYFLLTIANAQKESNATQMVEVFSFDQTVINSSDWETYKNDISTLELFDTININKSSEINVDGYYSYKVTGTGQGTLNGTTKEITLDYIPIWVENKETVYIYMYVGQEDHYNNNLSQSILESLKIK